MDSISHEPHGWQRLWGLRIGPKQLLAASLLATVGALVAAFVLPSEAPQGKGAPQAATGVSSLVWPASVLVEVQQPTGDQWVLPADAVAAQGAWFVLDTGNDRILKLDESGKIAATFKDSSSGGLALRKPMAIASDGRRLVVANSRAAEVLMLDLSGKVEQVLPIPSESGEKTPRPIGVAVAPDGGIVVSDAENHRVLRLDEKGGVRWAAGTGARAGGAEGFNVPGALTVDSDGNIYVVDILNGRVVKLSPEGEFIREYGQLGDTAGALARPKGVAVDGEGRVFVSDGLLAAIEVFAPDGRYLGFIGRQDPSDPGSHSLFAAPAGLFLDGDQLLVTDRLAGVIALRVSPARAP